MALVLGALLVLFVAPANAAHTYAGRATATALELTLAGEGLTTGFSRAAAQSAPSADGCTGDIRACAEGAGLLTPIFSEKAEAAAPGNPGPNDLTAFTVPSELGPLLTAAIGRAVAEASADTDSRARGDGGIATVDLTLTQTLAEALPIQDALQEISDSLLGPIAEGDPTGLLGPRLKATVDQLNENLSLTPILSVNVGPSFSEVTDIGGVTTARASAQGATIVLSPTPLNLPGSPEGLVIIEVGSATVSATTNQTAASATFDPALVRVKIFDPVTGTYDDIAVAPGQSFCVPGIEGTPLQICIGAGSGDATQTGAAAAATAAGVSIQAFQDPLPPLSLRLAVAEAGVNSAPPAQVPPAPEQPAPPAPSPDLPRTGSSGVLPALALLGAGSAAFLGIRRRRSLV
jgi:LPXTG-motif cell wall-anchored protein